MKMLSLQLGDQIFEQTEKVLSALHLAPNRDSNEALSLYNQCAIRRAEIHPTIVSV